MKTTTTNETTLTQFNNLKKHLGIFDELYYENNNEEISSDLKDIVLENMDSPKDQEGYYLDGFGDRVSFNGIRQLKRPYTKMTLSEAQQKEIIACHNDYFYFRKNYCKILTKSGIGRPDARDYQKRLEDDLTSGEDTIAFFPRQSGKCVEKDTLITIRDKETGEISKVTVKEFNEMCK